MQRSLAMVKKPLLIALLVSLLVHLVLFSQEYFKLPQGSRKDNVVINLSLVPKQAKPAPVVPKKRPPLKAKKPKPTKPKPKMAKQHIRPQVKPKPKRPVIVPTKPVITVPEAVETVTHAPEGVGVRKGDVASDEVADTQSAPAEAPKVVPASSRLPAVVEATIKPYQWVKSHYDVYADQSQQASHSALGKAQMHYKREGRQYTLSSLVKASGVMRIFLDDLVQESRGAIDAHGLKPDYFRYQYGKKGKKTYEASFDWAQNQVALKTKKGIKRLDLSAGTQDLLSFMFQFMFSPPLNQTSMMITNGKRLGQYDYAFLGEQLVKTKLGVFNTVHLLREDPVKNEKLALWLATDYQYLPVKIKKIKAKKNKIYELVIRSLTTDQGVVQGDQSAQAIKKAKALETTIDGETVQINNNHVQSAPETFNALIQR